MTRDVERVTGHRPWPLPSGAWIMYQRWVDLLFAHWDVTPERVRPLLPPPLEIDQYAGHAYVGVVPFRIEGLRARGLPPLPGTADFPELNVRTYVRLGDKPGVYFFSLDAASGAAVLGARTFYRLPYHRAKMDAERDGEWIRYRSERVSGDAAFAARYRPNGEPREAEPGTLDHFLTERYCLYAVPSPNHVLRAEIHHKPWRLQPAVAESSRNTMAAAAGLELPAAQPTLHFAPLQETLVWKPERVG